MTSVVLKTNKKTCPLWRLLLLAYLTAAFGFSVLQPLGRTPDETAHMQYAKFLAREQRFPVWKAEGGGEAGYEAQHPPLYYALAAVVYGSTPFLEERWRWQILRWATISIGVAMFFLCRRFFRKVLQDEASTLAATATVLLMPLTMLYTGYVNPDGMTMLLTTWAFYLTGRTTSQSAPIKYSVLLGVVCGLAVLTKLSGFPALLIALWAHARTIQPNGPPRRRRLAALTSAFVLTCGWWYVRNALLYGSPFIHTEGKLGSGLGLAAREGFVNAAWLTWRETFLSTWAQRGWFPAGFWEVALYSVVIFLIALAAWGLWKRHENVEIANADAGASSAHPLRAALNLSVLLIVLIFLGQQWAYWTMDVEFNAGGRYMLSALAAIALLLVTGVAQFGPTMRRVVFGTWIVTLGLMNLVSAWNIDTTLNPKYAPNWQPFHFVPGEEPAP
jgi:4-amino-4-deoxy-L-arabinose transferase-like glycosyltransferase